MLVLLACRQEPAVVPPKILRHPVSASISECEGAWFDVTVASEAAITYQWFANGAAIPGATTSAYEVPRAGVASDGSRFAVEVTNAGGRVRSDEAVLTVAAANPARLAPPHVLDFATDGGEVFWTDGNRVNAGAIDCDGPIRTLYERTGGFENTDSITLAGDSVLWTDSAGGRVTAATKDGGWIGRVTEGLGSHVWSISESDGDVFWVGTFCGVQTTPLAGGPIATLAPGPINSDGLAVDEAWVYWYVLDFDRSRVMRTPRAGGDASVLVTGLSYPSGIAADGQFVYLADTQGEGTAAPVGRVLRVSREGGEPSVLATMPMDVHRIALDDGFVYWTAGAWDVPGSGQVARVALDGGGAVEVLADGLTLPFELAFDERFVYWSDRDGIERLAKP